jgi:hypothetical protein
MFNKIKLFYANAYSGHEKAWKVFVFGYAIWLFPYSVVYGISNLLHAAFYVLLIRVIYNVWLCISMWKCSVNTKKKISNIFSKLFAAVIALDIYVSVQTLLNWKYSLV